VEVVEIGTQHGTARAHLELAPEPAGALVLGHGAGGGVRSPDLVAVAELARAQSISVVLVEQPYRVAGRRSPAPAHQLDCAWLTVIETLRAGPLGRLALIQGGRSSGARVACRTAAKTGCVAVLCLAFPLHPPGRGDDPTKSRLPELDAVRSPTLVVQGERDPFGIPPARARPRRAVELVPGDHSLRNGAAVRDAVGDWLSVRLRAKPSRSGAGRV
jgi:predicted alpha/beta-hydrolase family hydrolase